VVGDRSRTRPNKTVKCNTQKLIQGRLPIIKPYIQSFPDCNSTQRGEGLVDSNAYNRLNEMQQ